MTHPAHGADCECAPHCSAAACHPAFAPVPVTWSIRLESIDGVWRALSWRHPREPVTHRNDAGEPCDGPPKWAR